MSSFPALNSARSTAVGKATAHYRPLRPSFVVGAIVALSAGLAAVFGSQIVRFEPDELGYTHLAMGIAHSLTPFTSSYNGTQRLNQLYPLLISPLWGLFGNVLAFQLTHLWNALLMASAAIPAYLLAREVGVPRWASYIASALVAFAPWLTLSTAQLTEVAAYPACTWALLAMQRSLSAPSVRRDLVALLAIALAAYGRLQLMVLAPVFVLAVLVHELGYALSAPRAGARKGSAAQDTEPRRGAFSEALRRVARGHALLSGVAVIGLLVGVPLLLSGKLASAAGFYGDALNGATLNAQTFDLARTYLAFIALGLGALPVALAAGAALETFIAPTARRVHAFFSLSAVAVIVLTLQVAEVSVRFNGSTMQERYLFYIAPLLAVGMCASLLAPRRPASTILAGSLALGAIVASTHYETARNAFWYQVSPGMTSFYDWVRPLFAGASPPTADPGASRQLVAGLVVVGLGALLALLARRVSSVRLLAGVGVAAVAFCAAETTHALWRVVHGNASGGGFGGASLRDADWVDRAVSRESSVEQLLGNLGGLDAAREVWEQDTFWNRTVVGSYTVDSFGDPFLPTTRLVVNSRSGEMMLSEGPSPDPSAATPSVGYLVMPTRGFPVEPVGHVLARSPSGLLQLMRVGAPLRAAWRVQGVSPGGWLSLSSPATVLLYALQHSADRCASVGVTLSLSRLAAVGDGLSVKGSGAAAEAVPLMPGEIRTIQTRVCRSGSSLPQLRLSPAGGLRASYTPLSPRLVRVAVTPA